MSAIRNSLHSVLGRLESDINHVDVKIGDKLKGRQRWMFEYNGGLLSEAELIDVLHAMKGIKLTREQAAAKVPQQLFIPRRLINKWLSSYPHFELAWKGSSVHVPRGY